MLVLTCSIFVSQIEPKILVHNPPPSVQIPKKFLETEAPEFAA